MSRLFGQCEQCQVDTPYVDMVQLVFRCTDCEAKLSGASDVSPPLRVTDKFDLERYLGLWYELAHYPNWFERPGSHDTTAQYLRLSTDTLRVINATYTADGQRYESKGKAVVQGERTLRVDFSIDQQRALGQPGPNGTTSIGINYVVERLWEDERGTYQMVVVSTPDGTGLWLLSRSPHPPRKWLDTLMQYVSEHYDTELLIHTEHTRL